MRDDRVLSLLSVSLHWTKSHEYYKFANTLDKSKWTLPQKFAILFTSKKNNKNTKGTKIITSREMEKHRLKNAFSGDMLVHQGNSFSQNAFFWFRVRCPGLSPVAGHQQWDEPGTKPQWMQVGYSRCYDQSLKNWIKYKTIVYNHNQTIYNNQMYIETMY